MVRFSQTLDSHQYIIEKKPLRDCWKMPKKIGVSRLRQRLIVRVEATPRSASLSNRRLFE
jgi:hypothetical protein